MIGILVQLAISWLFVWLYEKGDFSFLGLRPLGERLKVAAIFFLLTALFCASGFFLRMYFAHETWGLNPKIDGMLVLRGIWWNLKSVFFEELIFRGALFYILIRWLGDTKAIIISSVAFGIYHWFSQEAFGNPAQMVVVFLNTGLMGFVFAFAYVRTGSILTPAAIHFGWNFTQGFIFSSGSLGNGVFVLNDQPSVNVSVLVYILVFYLPLVSAIVLNILLLRRWRVDWTSRGHPAAIA